MGGDIVIRKHTSLRIQTKSQVLPYGVLVHGSEGIGGPTAKLTSDNAVTRAGTYFNLRDMIAVGDLFEDANIMANPTFSHTRYQKLRECANTFNV